MSGVRHTGLDSTQRLALFRWLVASVVFLSADVWNAPGLIVNSNPDWVPVAVVFRVVVLAASAVTLVGWHTSLAASVLTAALVVLLGLVQRQGTPLHVHHLVWLAAIVAAARTGRAWSLDSHLRRDTAGIEGADSDAGALRAAAIVLGLVYFWPGVHKLVDAGSPFFDDESLARLVRLKAFEAHSSVVWNIDRFPTLLLVGGALVIAGELCVLPLAWWRPRLAGGLVFLLHAVFAVVMHLPYTVLWVFALVFLLVPESPRRIDGAPLRTTLVVIAIGSSAMGAAGAISGWPFACYPTFALPVPEHVQFLIVEVERDGVFVDVDNSAVVPDDVRTPLTWAMRQVHTEKEARRFLRQRMTDRRFTEAIAGGTRLRVSSVQHHLDANGDNDGKVQLTVQELAR